MRGDERDFSKSSYQPQEGLNGTSPTAFPANYSQTGRVTNANPASPNCEPPGRSRSPSATGPQAGHPLLRRHPDLHEHRAATRTRIRFFAGSLALGKDHMRRSSTSALTTTCRRASRRRPKAA